MSNGTLPDWTDPCAVLAWLKPIYLMRVAGQGVASVGFDSRSVAYANADVGALREEIARLESECANKRGEVRRFAMRLGARAGREG